MVKLYNRNLTREDINKLEGGDVIVYSSKIFPDNKYLIVSSVNVKSRMISGQIAIPIGVNALSIDDIVEAEHGKNITKNKA